ncbi:MAG: tRNA glutamyl-Q(34) synthetase GluQRS [Betaproteobacteria bacterium]
MTPARPYCGRFAPSPTGALHFGSLVSAMASWCDARAHGGTWKVRLEDVDVPRSVAGADAAILSALERHGFQWDGPVVRQSERTALYAAALDTLHGRGLLFPCACTRSELEGAPPGAGGERIYQGTCRGGVAAGRSARALRMRVGDAIIAFADRAQGAQRQQLSTEVGDFVVRRADGLFAYQLAVVVDDAEQGVTDVVRGADLLASTPRQIMLQMHLQLPTPSYLHHPVAVDAHGDKLSKSTGAAALPDETLQPLLAAWSFLTQRPAPSPPGSVGEFWQWAHGAWDASLMPARSSCAVTPARHTL